MEKVHLIKIGSAQDNDVVINDDSISPYHLELFQDHFGSVFITDKNTQSGTYVNGERVNKFIKLSFSDRVTIAGKFMFDWVKITQNQTFNTKIDTATNNWVYSENKINAVYLPEIEDFPINEDYELDSNADLMEKWKYFYTHNASIVHIFTLNFVLFILFYLAFLS
jgi:pSer/pThr/pTyr-binding forkhead associated (FHA) protein